jgi:hypothetical protein
MLAGAPLAAGWWCRGWREWSSDMADMKVWPPAAAVPAGYPAGLPFVPNRQVAVELEAGGVRVMKWWGVDRPVELVQQLIGTSVQEGWALDEAAAAPSGDAGVARRLRFARGTDERVIESVQAGHFSFVTLTERRCP